MPHMEGIFINGEKAKFHPEDILDTDASQYTEEIGESVTAYLTEHITNPTNPPIDTSLSIAGAAADAKKTGDELETLKSELEVTSSYNIVWSQGGINNSGTAVSRTNRIRTDYIVIENDSISVEIPSGFKYAIHAYNASKTRIGYIPDGSDIMTDRKATYKVSESYDNAVYFRMWVAYADDSDILPTEGDKVTVAPYESVVDTLKSHVLKSVRILGVGNSYTRDSIRWLCKILKESGYEDVVIGHGYLGASTLAEQYASLDSSDSNHSAFEYWKYTNNKNAVKTSGKTLDEIFTDEPWDIVVFQQQSDESGQYASYVSLSFDINDFITYISGKVSNAGLKFALMMPWSHSDGYDGAKFAEYYNSDPETMLDAIKTVIPQVADHMSQCDYVVNAGEAIDLGRQNSYLNALGDQMLRTDKNHLYYGIPSYMVGLTYALTLCDVNINNVMWYPTATDEGQTGITTSGYLAYLAKQCAETAVNGSVLADDISELKEDLTQLENTILVDDNILTVSSDTMSRSTGDGTVTFDGVNGFTYTRVTIGNNAFGFVFDTWAQKDYVLSFDLASITGESGLYVKVFVSPTEGYNESGAIATTAELTSAGTVTAEFTALNPKTSVWFVMRRYTSSAVIKNISVSDSILRYKYYIMDYQGTEVSVFNKILCIGDSLTEGTFNYTQNGSSAYVTTNANYSYPTYLKKLTGCDTTNMGSGGYTSVEWYTAHASDDLSGYDCAIIEFGVNDMRENVSIEDFSAAYHNIIDKLISDNKGIKVFVTTVIPAYSDYDRRYDAYDTEIRRIANEDYTNVYLIDLYEYSLCKLYTPYEQGHLTAIGYQELAHEIATIISYTIHNNLSDFANVQFIGTNYIYDPT